MTGWTAVVPIKRGADRKTRLRGLLTEAERIALTDRMLGHVLAVLGRTAEVARIAVLSPERPAWTGPWIEDRGRGLNAELQAIAAEQGERLLVVHADLPALAVADAVALLAAANAIAPDRHEAGTNAIALTATEGFRFAFGEESLARHGAGGVAIVRRPGLALDVDTADDLRVAREAGLL